VFVKDVDLEAMPTSIFLNDDMVIPVVTLFVKGAGAVVLLIFCGGIYRCISIVHDKIAIFHQYLASSRVVNAATVRCYKHSVVARL